MKKSYRTKIMKMTLQMWEPEKSYFSQRLGKVVKSCTSRSLVRVVVRSEIRRVLSKIQGHDVVDVHESSYSKAWFFENGEWVSNRPRINRRPK